LQQLHHNFKYQSFPETTSVVVVTTTVANNKRFQIGIPQAQNGRVFDQKSVRA
jgi:hypothetical protein